MSGTKYAATIYMRINKTNDFSNEFESQIFCRLLRPLLLQQVSALHSMESGETNRRLKFCCYVFFLKYKSMLPNSMNLLLYA